MPTPSEHILIVENDPIILDMVCRQALQPLGYPLSTAANAAAALAIIRQTPPDAIILDLSLPDLNGKDVLVALASQRVNVPVIVLAQRSMGNDIIQAFRLGAIDCLIWPVRETEVIAVVEKALKQIREKRDRETQVRQLEQSNKDLQRMLQGYTNLISLGKAIAASVDRTTSIERVIEGAVRLLYADSAWFLLRDEAHKTFNLAGHRNLPRSLAALTNQPWDDGIGSLVAMSGEPLLIHGEPLKKFMIANLGQAAMIMPVKIQKQVVGLIGVIRKDLKPFNAGDQAMLQSVSDFAAISLVNSFRFQALEGRSAKNA